MEANMNVIKSTASALTLACAFGACSTVDARSGRSPHYDEGAAAFRSTGSALTFSEAVGICNRVQQSKRIPFSCSVRYLRGQPTMVVAFANAQDLNTYAEAFATYVGTPFCDAAISENGRGYIVIALQSPSVGSIYSCESSKITQWFSLDELSDS
jgi:hypothetical protein